MVGKDLIMATLFGSGGTGGGGSSGGGIPQADINAAFAALAEKGVTVPDGATSADLDDLIASIVTGGGGCDYALATYTPTEDMSVHSTLSTAAQVTHNLGRKLNGVIAFVEKNDGTQYGAAEFAAFFIVNGFVGIIESKSGSGSAMQLYSENTDYAYEKYLDRIIVDENTIHGGVSFAFSYSVICKAGNTIHYVIW